MIAIANYDVTINGVTYEKGAKYDIDPKINLKNEYGTHYFEELEVETSEKVDENKNRRNKTTEKVDKNDETVIETSEKVDDNEQATK